MDITKNSIAPVTPETARAVEEYLVTVGKQSYEKRYEPVVKEINGGNYVFYDGKMNQVRRFTEQDEPTAQPVAFFTLQGLIDYIKTDVDGIFGDKDKRYIVRVANETRVDVLSKPLGYYKDRATVAYCKAPVPEIRFNCHMETEKFQTMLQTCFEESENRNTVLTLAGSVHREQSLRKSDDGMKQTVTIKDGVSTFADITFKNPVTLTPLRTFHEVKQPSSPFVLRFDEEGRPALFDGDGGAWKLKAVTNVVEWLRAQLDGCNVEVIG